MKKFLMIFFFSIILGIMAYLDSPYSFINNNYSYLASQPVIAKPLEKPTSENLPVIEKVLDSTEKESGYIIETYREYEVYKDKNGKVVKKEPTSKMDILKFWDYQNKNER
jgi:hypothetical protein